MKKLEDTRPSGRTISYLSTRDGGMRFFVHACQSVIAVRSAITNFPNQQDGPYEGNAGATSGHVSIIESKQLSINAARLIKEGN